MLPFSEQLANQMSYMIERDIKGIAKSINVIWSIEYQIGIIKVMLYLFTIYRKLLIRLAFNSCNKIAVCKFSPKMQEKRRRYRIVFENLKI